MQRSRALRLSAAGVGALLATSGCSSAGVELVEGNFANLEVDDVLVRGLVLVAGEDGQRVSVSGAFLNEQGPAERLTELRVEPAVGGDREPVVGRPNLVLPAGAPSPRWENP